MVDLVLDAPGKNALGSDLLRAIRERLDLADGAPVLLTGAGDAFSAGLDLREVAALDSADMDAFLSLFEGTVRALLTYPGPTVALVNGHAIAGGCILAMCCDWRVGAARPRARLGLNEVALGLRFPPGLLRMILARVDPRHRTRILLEAGLFDPDTAHELGLLDEVAPDDGVALARERLARLADAPPAAYAAAKRDVLREIGVLDEAPPAREAVVAAWTSPELKAKLAAALKR